jgi:hypothetical protein
MTMRGHWPYLLTGLVLGAMAWPVGYWIFGAILALNIRF